MCTPGELTAIQLNEYKMATVTRDGDVDLQMREIWDMSATTHVDFESTDSNHANCTDVVIW